MTELPSGIVTFLFTDIERSTQTVEALGNERYADVQDDHRRLLRGAFLAHGGVEVGTEGDAFFVAFARPSDAVSAAIEGQHALDTHTWPEGYAIRVRMGIHTGEALVRDGDYIGHDVHKAKRVSDAGHGGQILLSRATADLVGDRFDLRDIGSYRLKDLGEPERLFQVGSGSFPPLRSLETFRTNLPVARSALIGRTAEIAAIREALAENRLVTLTGIGGCGKTRLALHVGAEELETFEQGVFFVDLASVSDGAAIESTIGEAIGVSSGIGDAPRPGGSALIDHLASRNCLLILDNCEHLLDDAADITDAILAACPGVKILATSRESLEIEGEQAWRVPSLMTDVAAGHAAASEAASLFVARARAVDPSFTLSSDNEEAVTEICRRLDGIPLAIEFAAARVSHLSPQQIATRLDDMFMLLTGGRRRVQRQQTLQAALDWSYDLLDERDRVVLHRLAVFPGTFDLPAAESVCAGDSAQRSVVDILGSLVAKSLLATEPVDGETRYRLLETVRLYAEEKLRATGEADATRTKHRDHFVRVLEALSEEQVSFDPTVVPILSRELANIRAALAWSHGRGEVLEIGRILQKVGAFLINSGSFIEAETWASRVLEHGHSVPKDIRVDCMAFRAFTAMFRYDGTAGDLAEAAVAEAAGEPSVALGVAMMVLSFNAAILAAVTGSADLAREARERSDQLFEFGRVNDVAPRFMSYGLTYRSMTELVLSNYPAAADAARRALDLVSEGHHGLTGDPAAIVSRANLLAAAEFAMGNEQAALDAADRAYTTYKEKRSVYGEGLTGDMAASAVTFAATGRLAQARELGTRAIRVAREFGTPLRLNGSVIICACIAYHAGDARLACRLLSAGRHAGTSTLFVRFPTPESYVLYLLHRDLIAAALPAPDIATERARGKEMTIEEAVAEAEAFLASDQLAVDLA